MKQRGQTTLFIAVSVIILITVGILLSLTTRNTYRPPVSNSAIQQFLQLCSDQALESAIPLILRTGGTEYARPPHIETDDGYFPVYTLSNLGVKPFIENFHLALSENMKFALHQCLIDIDVVEPVSARENSSLFQFTGHPLERISLEPLIHIMDTSVQSTLQLELIGGDKLQKRTISLRITSSAAARIPALLTATHSILKAHTDLPGFIPLSTLQSLEVESEYFLPTLNGEEIPGSVIYILRDQKRVLTFGVQS